MASVAVLAVSGVSWGLSRYVNDTVRRVSAGTAGTPSSGPMNILLAGVDLRAGLTPAQVRALHIGTANDTTSDTMMLVHISASRTRVTVVSLPRDSWVHVPGHGMDKIDSAFAFGGAQLMVKTVEQDTGLTVNDYIEVNLLGFVNVVDALGGVNICLPFAINDPYSGLRLSAGFHHVSGITALQYARDRHSFALSDLTRIRNQQSLLSSLLSEAISSGTLANPAKLSRFLQAALSSITVDRSLDVTALADQLRGISLSDVKFMTVPLSNINYHAPNGELAVQWNAPAATALFASLKADQAPATAQASPKATSTTHKASHATRPVPAPTATQTAPPGGTTAGTRTAAQAACH